MNATIQQAPLQPGYDDEVDSFGVFLNKRSEPTRSRGFVRLGAGASDGVTDGIVGRSGGLRRVLNQVQRVAPTDSTVLICGETGTGKELIARAVHNASRRSAKPFVKTNCAALPATLLESELFGHERGAFTGAIAQRIGRFEAANGGTLFLDEIGEAPLEMQAKLLRVLQEREFERVGSSRVLSADVRTVAATNANLRAMVQTKTFRADLFYRLNVFPIHLPPLRDRREDIPSLVEHFTRGCAARIGRIIRVIPAATLDALVEYSWPGNTRELQNVIERAVVLSTDEILEVPLAALDDALHRQRGNETLESVERAHIVETLRSTNWVVAGPQGAANRLGLNRSTLVFRMKKLGIERPSDACEEPDIVATR